MLFDRTCILVILDGFGINQSKEHNAFAHAKAPHLKGLLTEHSLSQLNASEHHVGLPAGFMGNSEVGHLNIGAGRVVYQDFSLISKAITEGEFFHNSVLTHAMDQVKANPEATLHVMGLLSDGGVHSHISHFFAVLEMAKKRGLSRVAIHAFTDGRDTPPVSGVEFLGRLQKFCRELGLGKIETVSGRFYAMDRDSRWDRTALAYQALVLGKAASSLTKAEIFDDAVHYVKESYDKQITDEFVKPGILKGYSGIRDGDAVVFVNFRADRARQLTRALTQKEFDGFVRSGLPVLSDYVCMSSYDDKFALPVAYQKSKVPQTLGEVVSSRGGKQLRIAETEKYAHVTYFFNGGDEKVFPEEKRILIPSPREVATYDQKPEMAAKEVTDKLLAALSEERFDLVVLNYANCDMVGHTGNLGAAIRAVEAVDSCLGRVLEWAKKNNAVVALTADHGNCEMMQDTTGLPLTSHTLLPVPFVILDPAKKDVALRPHGKLSDIAPTLLAYFGVAVPSDMTGQILLAKA